MGRSDRRRTVVLVVGALAALAVACQAIVGLDRFSKIECTTSCDASPDAPVDGGADAADSGPGLEPSEASVAFRWAHWRMPNPPDAEVDANLAFYGQSTFNVVDGSIDGATVLDVVVDGVTGLTWTKSSSAVVGFTEASAYCEGLAQATGKAFRLPTRIELVSLLDYTQQGASIDPAFGATEETLFWTQSVALGQPDPSLWVVSFGKNGNADIRKTTATARARCVQ